MHNIKTLAYDFLIESKISSLPITLNKLDTALADDGIALLPYSKAEQILDKLPKEMGREVAAGMKESDGLTIILGKNTIILYSDELSYGERLLVAAHEIGHKRLGHKRAGVYIKDSINDTHEREAQAFAHYIIAPPCILQGTGKLSVEKISQLTGLDQSAATVAFKNLLRDKKEPVMAQEKELLHQFRHYINDNNSETKHNSKRIIMAFAIVFLIFVALGIFLPATKHTPNVTNPAVTVPQVTESPKPSDQETTVWKTKTGDTYHTDPNCYHITKTAYDMDMSDAIIAGYRKCKDCK